MNLEKKEVHAPTIGYPHGHGMQQNMRFIERETKQTADSARPCHGAHG